MTAASPGRWSDCNVGRRQAGGSVVNTQRLATRCAHEAATARPSMPAICMPPSTPGCRQSPVRRPPALNSAEVHTMRHAVRRQQSPNHCAWGDALRAPRVRRESGATCIVLLWLLLREPNTLHMPLAVSACQTNSLRHSMRHAHSSTHRTVATGPAPLRTQAPCGLCAAIRRHASTRRAP